MPPRTGLLPGGGSVATTTRDVHGAVMAATTVAFLGPGRVFVVQSSRRADRRLVLAGFSPLQVLAPRPNVSAAGKRPWSSPYRSRSPR